MCGQRSTANDWMTLNARFLILTAALVTIPAVSATATDAPRQIDQGTTAGYFDANGSGQVTVRGQLTAYGRIEGGLIVRDTAGGAVVKLNGVVQRPKVVLTPTGKVRVFTFLRISKNFYVKGKSVRVALSTRPGRELSISTYGRGQVLRLDGSGTFAVNGEATQSWLDAVLPITIRPAKKSRPS